MKPRKRLVGKARKVIRKKKKDYELGKLEEIHENYKRNKLKQFDESIRKRLPTKNHNVLK